MTPDAEDLGRRIMAADVAFEHQATTGAKTLWRVVSIRQSGRFGARFSEWYSSEGEARERVAWIENGRGELVSIDRYDLIPG